MVLHQIQSRILKLKKCYHVYLQKFIILCDFWEMLLKQILGYSLGMCLICRYYFISICFEEDHGNCIGRKACSQMAGFLAFESIVSQYRIFTLSFSIMSNIYSKNTGITCHIYCNFSHIDCILKILKCRTDQQITKH